MIRPIILLTISAMLLLMAVRKMRQMRLKERYALTFIFIAFPFLGLAIWPSAIERISTFLGISYFTVMLLAVSLFLILMVFELLTIVSVLDSKVSTLAQMIGIHHEKLQLIERANAQASSTQSLELRQAKKDLQGTDATTDSAHEADPAAVANPDKIVIKQLTFSSSASPDTQPKSSRYSVGG